MNRFFVMAKMDHEDGSFDRTLVEQNYSENYPLVPGHVWLVATSEGNSFDVAKRLRFRLVSGGNEEASGIVVPALAYWRLAHSDLWRLLQPTGESRNADAVGRVPSNARAIEMTKGKVEHGEPLVVIC